MNRHYLVAGIFVLLLVAVTGAYAVWGEGGHPARYDLLPNTATTTAEGEKPAVPAEDPVPAPVVKETGFGEVTLGLNDIASFPSGLSIRPTEVLEDSRCPENARCIQAGTVKVSVRIRSAMGVSTNTFEPGTSITTEAEEITLLGVYPEKNTNRTIAPGDYRFMFEVRQREVSGEPGRCYVGGCSAQICSDQPDVASTCEYRAEYGCYKTARCERQATGKCGWTETNELKSCLKDPPKLD